MKKDWKYILYLSLAVGVFVLVKATEPRQFDWTPTYSGEDKNPFGSWVLHELLPKMFPGKEISRSFLTIYELKDSLERSENILILAEDYAGSKEDDEVLLNHVDKGGTVLIGAHSFSGVISDTLKLSIRNRFLNTVVGPIQRDSCYLKFTNPSIDTTRQFAYRYSNTFRSFESYDSTRTFMVAKNDMGHPVAVRIKWGQGNFIFCSTPLALTNYYALHSNNYQFIQDLLSYFPTRDVRWTEYYSVGRMESRTPLRFILTQKPLAWAYYLTIASILLFMIFEAKRKQRVIPIVVPPQNTTLEFVGTVGNLYYHRGDHRNLAEKKVLFFFDQIRSRYALNPSPSEDFLKALAGKSGNPEEVVRTLLFKIESIRAQPKITKEELIELNTLLESFIRK